ncbi:MAG: hypothetical protein JSR77_04175 [Planctomycetes bacterium]|nr:hypothetical protein [Planctomycetota bacterium]
MILRAVSVLSAAMTLSGMNNRADAQLIRPDSATATSEFSGSYLVTNAINGSGLPPGFTPESEHATYVAGNHWTTRSGQTIGQSATFSFATPKTLGGFHMWGHRSNGVASNPYYAVTRFDLVLRDGAGSVLATHANLVGVPGVLSAQTYAFDMIAGVRSVQFIVRATNNNNASPYTGLAEVAFATCLAATASAPSSTATCKGGSAVFEMTPGGSGPFAYRWQFEDPSTGSWLDATEGEYEPLGLTFGGADTASLVVLASTAEGNSQIESVRVRCAVTNACGAATSQPATLSLCACLACPADFNQDGGIDGSDVDAYFFRWESGHCDADVNGDGGVDGADVDTFFASWEAGGCG